MAEEEKRPSAGSQLAGATTEIIDLSQEEDETSIESQLIVASESFVKEQFKNHDPSHDWQHVHRVRLMALTISRCPSLPAKPDPVVLELAALFHDLCDAKYLPQGDSAQNKGKAKAESVVGPFLQPWITKAALTAEQAAAVYRVVDNVSWSKDQARRALRKQLDKAGTEPSDMEQAQMAWERECAELHCVSDADRLDAIGSFGILRCAAFSAAKNRTLHVPPKNREGTSAPPGEQSEGYSATAIAHFYDKLINIKGDNLFTDAAREEADRRQQMLRMFLTELDIEWLFTEQGSLLSLNEE